MHTQDDSKLTSARVVGALKAGTMIAVLGFIVIMVERPMIFAASEVGTTPDDVSFLPHAVLTDGANDASNATDARKADDKGPAWNFAAPGSEAPPMF